MLLPWLRRAVVLLCSIQIISVMTPYHSMEVTHVTPLQTHWGTFTRVLTWTAVQRGRPPLPTMPCHCHLECTRMQHRDCSVLNVPSTFTISPLCACSRAVLHMLTPHSKSCTVAAGLADSNIKVQAATVNVLNQALLQPGLCWRLLSMPQVSHWHYIHWHSF